MEVIRLLEKKIRDGLDTFFESDTTVFTFMGGIAVLLGLILLFKGDKNDHRSYH